MAGIRTRHFSHYINWGQMFTVATGGYLALRALKLEEYKAGMQRKPLGEVLKEDGEKIASWFRGLRMKY